MKQPRTLFDNTALGENDNYLEEKNDFFETIHKAKLINAVIEQLPNEDSKNKMIALFGDWGSGKTSVLKYLEKNSGTNKVIFFEAWKLENDTDLRLSLLETIMHEAYNIATDEARYKIKVMGTECIYFFKNILLGSNIKIGNSFLGVDLNVGKALEDAKKEVADKFGFNSFYYYSEEFKKKFREIEKLLANTDEKIIIIIDDLDRCNPDKVIDLLSAIKHFFTFGEKAIYLFALDKNAVNKMIKQRYTDAMKSEEYLEKIFDLSFHMPTIDENGIDKFIRQVFTYEIVCYSKGEEEYYESFIKVLNEFFCSIKFLIPRHLKKIFNKYLLLEFFATNENIKKSLPNEGKYLPNIVIGEKNKRLSAAGSIFTLYLLILHEHHPRLFKDTIEIEARISTYEEYAYKGEELKTKMHPMEWGNINIQELAGRNMYSSLFDISDERESKFEQTSTHNFNRLLCLLLPKYTNNKPFQPVLEGAYNYHKYEKMINSYRNHENSITIDFCLFIHKYFTDKSKNHLYLNGIEDYSLNVIEFAKSLKYLL